jgi:hypothetical protein
MRHTAQLRLAAKLLRALTDLVRVDGQTISNDEILTLLAIVQLAAFGVRPESIAGSAPERLLGSLSQGRTLRIDATRFARTMTKVSCRPVHCKEIGSLIAIVGNQMFAPLLLDPCLLGWIHQLQIKESSASALIDGEISAANIGRATQWFTPNWIAQFLAERSLNTHLLQEENKLCTFLDPACGSGHILVHALTRCVFARTQDKEIPPKISQPHSPGAEIFYASLRSSTAVEETLHEVLASQIFGLDIDPLMIELCGFALYLHTRRLSPGIFELPTPALYAWRTAGGAFDSIGSLRLCAGDTQTDASLYSPLTDETRDPSAILPNVFMAIATNPPYLSHRNMPESISLFLKKHYPNSQYDLYAAFLRMAAQLLDDRARLAMICQQSFLSIQRYQGLRNELFKLCSIEAVAQLGPGAFAAKGGEKVNNALIVLCKSDQKEREPTDGPGQAESIRCWRLLSAKEKESAEEHGLENAPCQQVTAASAHALFKSIGNAPLALWCPPDIAKLFQDCAALESRESGLICSNGLFTCDNKRFVRTSDQVREDERHNYVPYDKGGGQKWYRTTPYLLRWSSEGDEIRQFRKSRGQSVALPGEQFYFRDGVTYSYIGTRGFKARLLSPGSIFDIASSAIFSDDDDDNEYLVGFLNSSLVCFLLGVLNPTINFQIGDLRRLPFVKPNRQLKQQIIDLSRRAIKIAQQLEQFDPHSPCYSLPIFAGNDPSSWPDRFQEYLQQVEQLNREEASIQSEINRLIFRLYDICDSTQAVIADDPWVVRSHTPICKPRTHQQHVRDLNSYLSSRN